MNTDTAPASAANAAWARFVPIMLTPVPLVSGDFVEYADGSRHTVNGITVTMTTDDGEETRIVLRSAYGSWWSPDR